MTLGLLVLAVVAVLNPPRVRSAVPARDAGWVAALGAVATIIVLTPLAAFARPLVDSFDVSAPTVRMAVGAVVAISGAIALVTSSPAAEPAWPGRRAALVPVAFPVLLTPGLGLLAVSGSLDQGAPVVLGVAAGALALVALCAVAAPAGRHGTDRITAALARVLAAAAVLSGLALIMNGVFDI